MQRLFVYGSNRSCNNIRPNKIAGISSLVLTAQQILMPDLTFSYIKTLTYTSIADNLTEWQNIGCFHFQSGWL